MASSAGTRGDVQAPTDADLDRAVERAVEADNLSRDALAATLYSRAETLARQLFVDEASLVPA